MQYSELWIYFIKILLWRHVVCMLSTVSPVNNTKADFHTLFWGLVFFALISLSCLVKVKKNILLKAFRQNHAASKHKPITLSTTHLWSQPVYPLLHINCLSQIAVMSHCFAQILLRYIHFEFPLICVELKSYLSAAHKGIAESHLYAKLHEVMISMLYPTNLTTPESAPFIV